MMKKLFYDGHFVVMHMDKTKGGEQHSTYDGTAISSGSLCGMHVDKTNKGGEQRSTDVTGLTRETTQI